MIYLFIYFVCLLSMMLSFVTIRPLNDISTTANQLKVALTSALNVTLFNI